MTSSVDIQTLEQATLDFIESTQDKINSLTQQGYSVYVILAARDEDDDLSHALISNIDDTEEMLTTLEEVLENELDPYRELEFDGETEPGGRLQ